MIVKIKYLFLALFSSYCMADISTKYQSSAPAVAPYFKPTIKPLVLNPSIDDIQQMDPRIKTIIMYARYKESTVRIVYFNSNNLRYANKVADLFKNNKIKSIFVIKAQATNLLNQNQVNVYLEESNVTQ